jgi:drug/metabolite transporter (DMT)-like permease
MPVSVLLVALGALQWGLSGGLASILMQASWSPQVITLWRVVIGLVCMAVWLGWRWRAGQRQEFNRRLVGWSAVAGIGVAGNLVYYFVSISAGSVAVAITLMYTAPVMVYLVSFLTRAERPTWGSGFVILATLIGVTMMAGVYGDSPVQLTALALTSGLLSGASYALFIFAFKSAGRHGSTPAALTVAFVAAIIALAPLVDWSEAARVPGSGQFPLFIVFGLMGAGLSFFCYFWGLRGVLPSTAAVTAMVEPATATLFGVLILGQLLRPTEAIGVVIILVAVTWLNIQRQLHARRARAAPSSD